MVERGGREDSINPCHVGMSISIFDTKNNIEESSVFGASKIYDPPPHAAGREQRRKSDAVE